MGAGAYFVTGKTNGPIEVSKREFIIGSVISIAVLLITGPLVEHMILDNKTTYYEYYNGYETSAIETPIVCDRDGNCEHSYSCDPYEVYHYTKNGGYYTTEYHQCPYVKVEYQYTVNTTLKDYRIGDQFVKDRTAWRSGEGVPADLPNGPPQQWLIAKASIDNHRNDGVTEVKPYKNLLLASDRTILDQYSADIANYQKSKLLPPHTVNYSDSIYNQYMADKFTAIDLKTDTKAWNESLLRLNGYFGMQLQGDVHMVAIDASKVNNPDNYSQALFAYWKSPQSFGKYAFPKNGIGIAIGVTNNKVVWARATGGLPVGNEALLLDIQNNLVGVNFTPSTLIGLPLQKTGALYSQLWGVHKFNRPHEADYAYLASDTYVNGWNRFWIIFVTTILSAGMWIAFLNIDDRTRSYYSDNY